MAGRRSICRSRPRAIRGTPSISPPDRAAAPARRSRPGVILCGIGTDTGGSIRGPAALCGIAGLKPTYGLVSRAGVAPAAFSLDHIGPMAWTAEDCAIMLQVLAGHDPADPASATHPVPDYRAALTGNLKDVRVGVIRHFHEEDYKVEPAVQAGIDNALAVFRSLGADGQ